MSRIKVFLKDRDKKNYAQIAKEVLVIGWIKKELPLYYFGKFLYRTKKINYKEYLSQKEIAAITSSKNLHNAEYAGILRNKLAFSIFAERHGIQVPKLICYNLRNRFFYNNTLHLIADVDELIPFFRNVFNDSGEDALFIKAIAEMGGKDCFLFTKDQLDAQVKAHGNAILSGAFIHQKRFEQHPEIDAIYSASINTLRVDSYIDKQGKTHILSVFMRFGAGGSFVDNASSGGFYVPVNLELGTLAKHGHQLMKYGGREYEAHPDTGYVFGGFQIPLFEETCALVINAVTHIPDKIIGWDIAIGKEHPVIIEGNDNNSVFMSDIAYGGYLKHPLLKEILEEA